MKSGISLVEMAQEIQRQNDLKADYMLDTRSLRLEPFGGGLYLNAYDQSGDYAVEPLEVNAIAHRQIGTHLKIPAAYYDKMLEEYPELLAQNVNAWFQREPAVRMVRTIDGTARAFLSNRYRRIDNLDIAGIVLPVLQEMEGMHFESCQLTDSRMYIKVVNTRLEAEVVPGDIVQSGIIISNSEVGLGSVSIQPLVYRLVCSNGMVVNDAQTRRNHVGRVNEASENYQLYSEKTLEGIILYNHSAYTLWPEGSEYDEDTKPLCSSVDGKTGIGVPGGACATCPMNAYGSAKDGGRGKACKNMRHLYLLRSGEYMPLLVSLPPTSIRPFKEFLNRAFVYRQRATYGSLVQIGLKKDSNGSNDYSVATFRLLRDFQGEELAQIRAYANVFKGQIKTINIQRALINEEQRANDCDYEIPESATAAPASDGSYVVGEINGDYEQLPA